MNEKKLDTWKFIFVAIGIFALFAILFSIYMKSKYNLKISEIMPKLIPWLEGFVILCFIVYWLLWKWMFDKPEVQIVDTVEACKIMTEELAKKYDIGLQPPDPEDGYCKLMNKRDIVITDMKRFFWGMTTNIFYQMDIKIRDMGYFVYIVQLDLGKEFLRKNYNMWLVSHQTHSTVNLQKKMYPMATAKSDQLKLAGTYQDLKEQGMDTTGMESMLNQKAVEEEDDKPAYAPRYTPPAPSKQEEANQEKDTRFEDEVTAYQNNNQRGG